MFEVLMRRAGLAAAVWVAATSAASAADRPARYGLPDDTLFVVRVPAAARFLENVKLRTKLGRVLSNETRVAEFKKFFHDEAGDDLDVLQAGLDRLGLTADDVLSLLDGEVGYAGMLLPNTAGSLTAFAGIAWADTDDERIDKWFAALDRKLQDQPTDRGAIRREDVDLAGTTVVHLTVPLLIDDGELSVGAADKTDAAPQPADNPQEPKKEPLEIGQIHLFAARGDDRLTVAHTFTAVLDPKGNEAAEAPIAAAAGIEGLQQVLAQFLTAVRGADESIVHRWEQTPGLAESLPDGEPLVEALVNVPRLVALANVPGNEEAWKFVQAAALDKLGPLAYRTALDGAVLRSGLFLSVPAPRTGLLTLLDQTPLKPEPADWVAKTAVGYQHVSLDLGKVYRTVAQLLRESYPRGEGALNALETQSQAFLQTDPDKLLSALGKTHTILTYLPALADEEDARRANRDDAAAQTAMAFVWSPSDEALLRRLMQMLSAATATPIVTEQGFVGVRYQEQTLHGSWFIGNGYMILALGNGVTEKVLANLRSTARSDETLRGTDYARRAAELLPAAPTLSYDLTDGAGLVRFADGVMQRAFADTTDAVGQRLKLLWPTPEEWEGSIGVSASSLSVDGQGVTYRSVLDLPSP